jgi:hypothetical protein
MGCQSVVDIGDNLTFSICTHDPDTGVLTDADAAPIYRVYEDETAVPILTGTMALLDAVNTTGFYSELIACTVANGFEDGKSYTIYISATVDGDTGGICYGFRAQTPVWSEATRTLTQSATAIAAAVAGGTVTIHRGDSLSVSITGLGDISTRTKLWFTVKRSPADADTASIIQIEETAGLVYLNGATGTAILGDIAVDDAVAGDITITLDETATDDLVPQSGLYYDIQMKTATTIETLSAGPCNITADITRVVV